MKDATSYLLSSPRNAERLLRAIRELTRRAIWAKDTDADLMAALAAADYGQLPELDRGK